MIGTQKTRDLESMLKEYIDPNLIHVQYVTNLLRSNSQLTVTEDIVCNKGILLAKKGFVLTKEQKERLIAEKTSHIDEHLSIAEPINLEKIFEYVTNINQKLSTIGYNFNAELELIDSIISQMNLDSKLKNKLTVLKNNSETRFDETILIAFMSTILKKSFDSNKKSLSEIFTSALFHRIGELHIEPIPETGNVTQEELNRIYAVPLVSHLILKNSQNNFSENILNTVLCQSEFLDGSGYPRKISANQIPQDARILSLIRTYNALLRKGNAHLNAVNILNSLSYSSVNPEGKVILPKYDSRVFEVLKNNNLESIVLGKEFESKFDSLIQRLRTELEKTYIYFTILNEIANSKDSRYPIELKLVQEPIYQNLKLFTSSGMLGNNGKISTEFFKPENLDLTSYQDMQNIILPQTITSLQYIRENLKQVQSNPNIPKELLTRATSHLQELSLIVNRYHNHSGLNWDNFNLLQIIENKLKIFVTTKKYDKSKDL